MTGHHIGKGRGVLALAGIASLLVATVVWDGDPLHRRAVFIAGSCIILWLLEAVPPFVPTIILLAATPLVLGSLGEPFRLVDVLTWPADPVMVLFAGGFALGVAAQKHGIDRQVAGVAVRLARGDRRLLLGLVVLATTLLSMWMSNVAAAAMMIAAIRPIVAELPPREPSRRALLLGVALGANFGGMMTPIGTGPNGIAIAAVSNGKQITFFHWMGFAVPLAAGMVLLGLAMLLLRYGVRGRFGPMEAMPPPSRGGMGVVVLFGACVLAWLAEPLHGFPAALVALLAVAALFVTRLLERGDLGKLDWSTLGLIAGGVSVGKLLEHSGIVGALASQIPADAVPRTLWLGGLVAASALCSSVMSNTATAAMLIPIASSLDPSASTAVLTAIGCSLGVPFTISTPPNAMVYGEGGLTAGELLWLGFPLMLIGGTLITFTGVPFLQLLGVR
jgi:sodium-dependent dicarboxylate transporter 2/3/5